MSAEYRRLHWGNEPNRIITVKYPLVQAGDEVVEIGRLLEVAYQTSKGKIREEIFVHGFDKPQPKLCLHLPSRTLLIVGGNYKVDARGIVG